MLFEVFMEEKVTRRYVVQADSAEEAESKVRSGEADDFREVDWNDSELLDVQEVE